MDTLRFLLTSDTHGGLTSIEGACHLPRLTTALEEARQGLPTLLLDNGDTFYGGLLANQAATCPAAKNPIARWIRHIGFNALNIGNEDLRPGLGAYRELVQRHDLPALSTNLAASKPGPIARHRVLTMPTPTLGAVRVGVVGAVAASACHAPDPVELLPLIPSLAAEVGHLRAHCDLIVVLCHAGLGGGAGFPAEEVASLEVASLPGVDLVVAGHLHELAVVETEKGVPVVSPGCLGQAFGLVDFTLERRATGLRVAGRWIALHSIERVRPDAAMARLFAPHLARLRATGERILGQLTADLTTEFAPFVQPNFLRVMEACFREQVLEATGREDVLIATQCAGGRGPLAWTTVPRGPLSASDLLAFYPYQNELILAEASGSMLASWLEESARIFRPLAAPRTVDADWQPVLDESLPFCDHDYLSDIDFKIDLRRPPGSRILDATWRGQPLEPGRRYGIVLNNYRYQRLAQRFSGLRRMTVLAPCIRSLLEARICQHAQRQHAQRQHARGRRFEALGPPYKLFFRTRARAQTAPPQGIDLMSAGSNKANPSLLTYAFHPSSEAC